MSLRTRIALVAAGAVAAVSIALGGIGYFSTRSQLIDGVRQQLRQRATPAIANRGGDRGNSGNGDGHAGGDGRQGPGAQVCGPGVTLRIPRPELGGAPGYFQSVCPSGHAVVEGGGTAQLPVTKQVLALARSAHGSFFFTATVQNTHLEILATGDPPDDKAIEVALPLTTVDSTLSGLSVTYLVLAGVGVALAAALGLVIGRGAVAPIRRFTSRTETVISALERQRLDEHGPAELRRLAASFNQTLDALERSVQAQRHLIADASHELRTPMAALRSNIQIFLEAERLSEADRRDLQASIVLELDELTQLVSDVLELARGAAPSDHTEPIELDTLVAEAVQRVGRRAAGTVSFGCDLEPTVVEHTPEAVMRAVTNVLDNARKWSPEGGVVEVELHGGVLTVRDHGPGFDPADLDHVFERFFRSDRARRMPGSGLGLAIVKQVAEARGGFATAALAPDGGAMVRVAFAPAASG